MNLSHQPAIRVVQHSPVWISVGANREGQESRTVVQIQNITIRVSTYIKSIATLNDRKGMFQH